MSPLIFFCLATLAFAQQQCYFGPGAEHRGPSSLVPCKGSGASACCLLGDTCLSGNTCYNYRTGNVYQYGCTDISYQDSSCPYKCGFNSTKSPWTAMEYCGDVDGITNTWICHAPESCSCSWNSTFDLLVLEPIGCKEMGSNARVALFAPSTLAPYISLPSTFGGSTGYYSTTTISGSATWISTAIPGYTPDTITELTTYLTGPSSVLQVNAAATPAATTLPPAHSLSVTIPAATSTGDSTGVTTSDSGPTKLSIGAQAGIGAGAGVAGVLLIAITILLCRSRRQQQQALPDAATQSQSHTYDEAPSEKFSLQHSQIPSPYSGHSTPWQSSMSNHYFPAAPLSTSRAAAVAVPELHCPPTYELSSSNQIHELSSYKSRENVGQNAPRFF